MMGLGAMIGTGVFVSIGVAAEVSGPSVVLAIIVAALVAVCNGLSSAQLAASHSVSGGTYEYGYKYLTPALGFSAGWMFLCAKSASAATAALGFAGYFVHVFGLAGRIPIMWLGAGISLAVTGLVLGGMRRSSLANIVIVSVHAARAWSLCRMRNACCVCSWPRKSAPAFSVGRRGGHRISSGLRPDVCRLHRLRSHCHNG